MHVAGSRDGVLARLRCLVVNEVVLTPSRLGGVPQRGVVAVQPANVGSQPLAMCGFSRCIVVTTMMVGLRWSYESIRSLRWSRGSQIRLERARV